jgi:uncharacterized protein (UPF0248 family)
MQPIQDVLHRIQWDRAYAQADFQIGYWDRVARRIVRVPLRRIDFPAADGFAFEATEGDGSVHSVPLHRVREVWRDGALIWQRQGHAEWER